MTRSLPRETETIEILLNKFVMRHHAEHAGADKPSYRSAKGEAWVDVVSNLDHPFVAAWPETERGRLFLFHVTEALCLHHGPPGSPDAGRHAALKDNLLAEFAVRFGLAKAEMDESAGKKKAPPHRTGGWQKRRKD